MSDSFRGDSPESTDVLRVGLMLDSTRVPAWTAAVVQSMLDEPSVDLALVVRNSGRAPRRHSSLPYRAYGRFDALAFRDTPDAFARVNLTEMVAGVPELAVVPEHRGPADHFPGDALKAIGEAGLDVLVRFGFRILRGEVLGAARLGIWSYHHGDPDHYRGSPPGYWEVMERAQTTGVVLQRLDDNLDAGEILVKGVYSTYPWSVRRNRQRVYWKAVPFVARALRAAAAEQPLSSPTSASTPGPMYRNPSAAAATRNLLSLGGRIVSDRLQRLGTRKRWHVLWGRLDNGVVPVSRWQPLRPDDPAVSWADPFPLQVGDRTFLFLEEIVEGGHGRVVCAAIDADDEVECLGTVLEEDFHLSYPCVFESDGDFFMVPESAASRQIRLYRAVGFPLNWQLDSVLVDDVRAVDPTPFRHNGDWWMFANVRHEWATDAHDELCLFHAPRLRGPWQLVSESPLKVDCRSSRPAGRVVAERGQLYRPAQDHRGHYGGAIGLHRLESLDLNSFRETRVAELRPHWDQRLLAAHTFNRAGDVAVIDVLEQSR